MATLEMNVNQVNSDFQSIKTAITDKGIAIDDGTKTSEYADKVSDVYEAGQQSEYDRFWDAFQQNGERSSYAFAFAGDSWNGENFKPKYDIKPKSTARYMFAHAQKLVGQNIDELLSKSGVILDTSGITASDGFSNFMQYSCPHTMPEIDTTGVSNLSSFMYYASIYAIKKIRFKDDGSQTVLTMFNNSNFVKVEVEGVIGKSLKLNSASSMTVASAISFITHLKNYSGTDSEFANTLTLSSTTKTALDNEGATSPNGNTWAEYITDIGWILN